MKKLMLAAILVLTPAVYAHMDAPTIFINNWTDSELYIQVNGKEHIIPPYNDCTLWNPNGNPRFDIRYQVAGFAPQGYTVYNGFQGHFDGDGTGNIFLFSD